MAPNVVIFGETGAGKSSLINLLADTNVAPISSGSVGCTLNSSAYNVLIDGTMFKFHDTAGLGESQGGTVVKQQAIVRLYELLRSLNDGVNLLIFCMRGPRIQDSVVRNWQLVWDIICQKPVPILLAVTGMENEKHVDAWWEQNQTFFKKNLMCPNSMACITATRGKISQDGSRKFDLEYAESREKIMRAFQTVYLQEGWKVQSSDLFEPIFLTMSPPNVVIFGETGAGKSSIINLLADAHIAPVSSSSLGYTFNNSAYSVSIGGTTFKFHDTAGLASDESQGGRVVKQQAIVQLYELLRSLNDGINLLIFCMRGPRIKDSGSIVRNWQLVWDIICQRRVPILLVVTEMENEEYMDAWWEQNQTFFTRNLMYPNSVACITATRGRRRWNGEHTFDAEYEESRRKMTRAVQAVYRRDAWKVQKTEWIKNRGTVFGSATNELICRNLMTREEAEKLAALLKDK